MTTTRINVVIPTSGGQIQASAPVTLLSRPNRLDLLDDVIEGQSPANGSVLTYRSSDDKYVLQPITVENLGALSLDGGSF
jgi:hypothetical protein